MSNDFLQWNPSQINQQSSSAYLADSQRLNGAVSGLFPSILANKLFYQSTTMVAALGQMMSNKGYVISDADIAVLTTALANILTKADFGSSAGTVCEGNDSRFFAAGTKLWFYQNTAPIGWTIDSACADAILAVKGGSNAYNAAGGTQAGTWTQPGHLHATADHILTVAEMPAHVHSSPAQVAAQQGFGGATNYLATAGGTTGSTGGDGAHNHGNTGTGATASTWRPLAQVGIICTKD